jgi:hypothetical protein
MERWVFCNSVPLGMPGTAFLPRPGAETGAICATLQDTLPRISVWFGIRRGLRPSVLAEIAVDSMTLFGIGNVSQA